MDDYLRFLRSKVGHARLVLPAVGIFALDSSGRLLLQRRRDNGMWAQPGGYMQPGEDAQTAAIREALEETGYRVEVTGMLGLYSDPEQYLIRYPNSDEVQVLSLELEPRLGNVGRAGTMEGSRESFHAWCPSPGRADRSPALPSSARLFRSSAVTACP